MTTKLLMTVLGYAEPFFCLAVLVPLLRSKSFRKFSAFLGMLFIRFASITICMGLITFTNRGISVHLAYELYFYVYWTSYALEAALSLVVIYELFQLAMEPLEGLADLGRLVFRWAAGISAAIACGIAVIPHQSGIKFMVTMVTQLQEMSSILTLCLLLFVCFTIRPLGLTFRSRLFGVSLGLGIVATTDLVRAAWLSHNPYMFSAVNLVSAVASLLALAIWTVYFVVPEPERQMIIVPTTSPYLKWNHISEVLGDAPGFVALGAFNPAFLAPAEWEIMARNSERMAADALAAATLEQDSFNPAVLPRSA